MACKVSRADLGLFRLLKSQVLKSIAFAKRLKHPLKRFVILKHDPGHQLHRTNRTHFDWMFELDGVLRTFSTDPIVFNHQEKDIEVSATELPPHRIQYLNIRGSIGRGLGIVTEIASGVYRTRTISPYLFSVDIDGHQEKSVFCARCTFQCLETQSDTTRHTCWQLKIESIKDESLNRPIN